VVGLLPSILLLTHIPYQLLAGERVIMGGFYMQYLESKYTMRNDALFWTQSPPCFAISGSKLVSGGARSETRSVVPFRAGKN
jgi:hypothetical protein